MPLTESIRRWRRLRRFQAVVAKAVRDPSQIERLAENSGFDAEMIRRCVYAITGRRSLVVDKAVTVHRFDAALAERGRRAICMLLEWNALQHRSESIEPLIDQLTDTLAADDEQEMTRICRLIEQRRNAALKAVSVTNLSHDGHFQRADSSGWLVTSLVECAWGNPELISALSEASWYAREALAGAGGRGTDDILVVAVRRMEREKARLEQLTGIDDVGGALELLARETLDRDLWWSMSAAKTQSGTIWASAPIPPDVDLAWTVLQQFAVHSIRLTKIVEPYEVKLKVFDGIGPAIGIGRYVKTVADSSGELSLNDSLRLAVWQEIKTHGTLSWEACLRLANARAWPYRYVDAWNTDGALHVSVDQVAPRGDGAIELRYRALQQPLSYRFRSHFEELHTGGRIRLLTTLVDHAVSACRAAVIVARGEEIEQYVRTREEALWQRINGGGASA